MEKVRLGPETLLYPMPAVLVGAIVEGKPNFMTAAWCGIACRKPPAVAVAVYQKRYTLKGIREKGAFSINVPSTSMAERVDFCGIYSGSKRDKSALFDTFDGSKLEVPLVRECPVNLECRVMQIVEVGSHVLVIGEIVESYVNEDCMKEGVPDPMKIDPLIYSPKTQTYHKLGGSVGKAFHIGKDLKV